MPAAVPLNLLPEMVEAGAWRLSRPLRVALRSNWFYRRLLKGPLTDHIAFQPHDACSPRLEDADALLRGRFRFYGETVDVAPGASVFDLPAPSRAWAEELHGFSWLAPLAAAGGEAARLLATELIGQWVKRYPHYCEPQWTAHVMARRLMHIFSHSRSVVLNSDMMWRSRLFVSLREQVRMLERTASEAPDGLPRLEAASALTLSGLCLDDNSRRFATGLALLELEITRQVLPDGGYVSRSPEDLLNAYRHLMMVKDALAAANEEPPHNLRNALDRMAPMLRFFRHGDGGLALFQGGQEGDPKMLASLLARDEVRGQPFGHARHSGYQRLAASRTLVQLDCGGVPGGILSNQAHAGFLAFEMSSGPHRVVVNCGPGGKKHKGWDASLRATAAHSTVTVGDRSAAEILPPGMARDLLGPRLMGGPRDTSTRRSETALGWMVEAGHDAYVPELGFRHERRITLSPQGLMVTGADRLVPVRAHREPVEFALRFHIHPEIRMSRLEGGAILLKLPNGEGWRFRAGGGELDVEESIYVGGDTVRRTEQLVVTGKVRESPVEAAWVFEQIVV
ncbi:MAG TPA: heparinase II/III family protein [Rhizomicrobium sp.]|nr:heparinase II/III family protein [Rhizomicrobium sp.]